MLLNVLAKIWLHVFRKAHLAVKTLLYLELLEISPKKYHEMKIRKMVYHFAYIFNYHIGPQAMDYKQEFDYNSSLTDN